MKHFSAHGLFATFLLISSVELLPSNNIWIHSAVFQVLGLVVFVCVCFFLFCFVCLFLVFSCVWVLFVCLFCEIIRVLFALAGYCLFSCGNLISFNIISCCQIWLIIFLALWQLLDNHSNMHRQHWQHLLKKQGWIIGSGSWIPWPPGAWNWFSC